MTTDFPALYQYVQDIEDDKLAPYYNEASRMVDDLLSQFDLKKKMEERVRLNWRDLSFSLWDASCPEVTTPELRACFKKILVKRTEPFTVGVGWEDDWMRPRVTFYW